MQRFIVASHPAEEGTYKPLGDWQRFHHNLWFDIFHREFADRQWITGCCIEHAILLRSGKLVAETGDKKLPRGGPVEPP
ncbi:hypothetical protein NWFMUON74_40250 [Nocardia wallacei]|uniref:Uncharacterized protein n=1 Tax=Nocardia wallacei TaxID=480035 RepID=A0A7G1KPY5_9NOCA|nr:hypothetical protein NWFMUON74_40250 [Nocardia wallacei]